MLRHRILLEMIVNRICRVLRRKQVVVQQVQRNEVLTMEQQQHRIHQVYIRMKIHQDQSLMNNKTIIRFLNDTKFVDIICHMWKFSNEFFHFRNVQY